MCLLPVGLPELFDISASKSRRLTVTIRAKKSKVLQFVIFSISINMI